MLPINPVDITYVQHWSRRPGHLAPSNIGIVISTRPEVKLDGPDQASFQPVHLKESDEANQKDLGIYLKFKLHELFQSNDSKFGISAENDS